METTNSDTDTSLMYNLFRGSLSGLILFVKDGSSLHTFVYPFEQIV